MKKTGVQLPHRISIHSQRLCSLSEFCSPLSERFPGPVSVQEFSVHNLCAGAAHGQIFRRPAESASAGSCEKDDRLPREVITLQKCVDDRGRCIPPYCVSKLIQSTSCGYRFLIYENTTIYVLFHSSPRTHMVLGIVFRLTISD